MLFYDLDLGAWVRSPGSQSPPQMVPCLTIGGVYQIEAAFTKGEAVQNLSGGTFFGGVKIKSDYAGEALASDSSPSQNGDESIVFSLDLTTDSAKSYFVANPTADTASAVFVIAATVDGVEFKTSPFELVIQNDYFPQS